MAVSRQTFAAFVDRAFWTMLLSFVGFGVHFLSDLSTTVHNVDEKMVVVIERINVNETHDANTLRDHEFRLRTIEARNKK